MTDSWLVALGCACAQYVNISLRVLSRPKEEMLSEIFSKIGLDFDERVLPGVGNEVLKAVVVSSTA